MSLSQTMTMTEYHYTEAKRLLVEAEQVIKNGDHTAGDSLMHLAQLHLSQYNTLKGM